VIAGGSTGGAAGTNAAWRLYMPRGAPAAPRGGPATLLRGSEALTFGVNP
jgi:hypothetical protein